MADNKGTNHFILQRITAIVLIPLSLWFCFMLASIISMDFDEALNFLQSSFNFFMLLTFIGVMSYHLLLGMEIIIEDYISELTLRSRTLKLTKFIILLLMLTASGLLILIFTGEV